jgi:2-polyprenyl-6-methoxyphenol hydroxylase-like FAD-dependent oxidoreductase
MQSIIYYISSCFSLKLRSLPSFHQDAWLLAHVLAHPSTTRTDKPSIIPDALKIYDSLRRPFSQASQESSRINGQLVSLNPERTDPLIGTNPGIEDFKKWGDALYTNWEWGESLGYAVISTSVLNFAAWYVAWNTTIDGDVEEAKARMDVL